MVRPFLGASVKDEKHDYDHRRDAYDIGEFRPKLCEDADDASLLRQRQYDFPYSELLTNATFGLVPRGHSRFSYRFLEVLDHGAVPVVVSDGWRLPFDDIIDWAGAAFRAFRGRRAPHRGGAAVRHATLM